MMKFVKTRAKRRLVAGALRNSAGARGHAVKDRRNEQTDTCRIMPVVSGKTRNTPAVHSAAPLTRSQEQSLEKKMPHVITPALLVSILEKGKSRRIKKEKDEDYLARQTHLHLSGRRIGSSAWPKPNPCPKLVALYLFDNALEAVDGLSALVNLTTLYMQNNRLESLGDLSGLTRLKKLYLSHNCLASLAPLAPLTELEDLQVASQMLVPGTVMDLAPHVLGNMRNLEKLDLANNNIYGTDELAVCESLTTVNLSKNPLESLPTIAALLNSAPLNELDLRGCPLSDDRRNLDAIIVVCPTIQKLNDRELIASERPYLQQLHNLGRRRVDMVEVMEPRR